MKKTGKLIIIFLILLIVAGIAFFILKDKIFKKASTTPVSDEIDTNENTATADTDSQDKTENQTDDELNNTSTTAPVTNTTSTDSNSGYTSSTNSKITIYVGKNGDFKSYEVEISKDLSVTDQATAIINEIGTKLGYKISVKDIYSGKGGMSIDFNSESAPFNVEATYIGSGLEKYKTSGQAELAKTIFDSIKESLQKYFGSTLDVYFSKNDENIVIDTVSPVIKINSSEPYKGI